ncbi:MAG: hypothetical protein KC426_04215 [Oceanospirillaceae bacterium]|nr:hypothetical protein [Oceanospirillaceae bacterium]
MFIRTILVVSYLLSCLILVRAPWRFYKLNEHYFNKEKGIYSKQAINDLIPQEYRLHQRFDHADFEPKTFPVFVKPEWGQNSKGVQRVDSLAQLDAVRKDYYSSNPKYPLLVQESAQGVIEFEVFVLASSSSQGAYGYLSITQVVNAGQNTIPVNGIHNPHTSYVEITEQFSTTELQQLWSLLKPIGEFNISRFGIKSNSKAHLLKGIFNIIEINLLLPMPMVLLSSNTSLKAKMGLAINLTWKMALLTKAKPQVNGLASNSPLLSTSISKQTGR